MTATTSDAGADELHVRLLGFVGRTSGAPRIGADAVNEPMIRHWCQAMGDTNPAYTDPGWAASGPFGHVVAPAAMLQSWTHHDRRFPTSAMPGDGEAGNAEEELVALLADAGYTSVVATGCTMRFTRHLAVGDRVGYRRRSGRSRRASPPRWARATSSPPRCATPTPRGGGLRRLRDAALPPGRERLMDFSFDDDQTALAALAREMLTDLLTPERLRAVAASEPGWDEPLWRVVADAGLVGIALPETCGGSARGVVEACLSRGRSAARSPPSRTRAWSRRGRRWPVCLRRGDPPASWPRLPQGGPWSCRGCRWSVGVPCWS